MTLGDGHVMIVLDCYIVFMTELRMILTRFPNRKRTLCKKHAANKATFLGKVSWNFF